MIRKLNNLFFIVIVLANLLFLFGTITQGTPDRYSNQKAGLISINIQDTTAKDTISILSPDSSSVWIMGNTYAIEWTTSTTNIQYLNFYLFKSGSENLELKGTNNSYNSWNWEVPSWLTPDTDYQIKIEDADNSSVYDYSDYFEIKSGSESTTTTPPPVTTPPNNTPSLFLVIVVVFLVSIVIVVIVGFAIKKSKKNIKEKITTEPAKIVEEPRSALPEKVSICSYCGAEILDKTSAFCSKCGAPAK